VPEQGCDGLEAHAPVDRLGRERVAQLVGVDVADTGALGEPMSLPKGSKAAATWMSRCVSTPPVMPRGASTMVMAIPSFLKRWVDGTAVPDRMTGARLVVAS
jgi:hypothetical protein